MLLSIFDSKLANFYKAKYFASNANFEWSLKLGKLVKLNQTKCNSAAAAATTNTDKRKLYFLDIFIVS